MPIGPEVIETSVQSISTWSSYFAETDGDENAWTHVVGCLGELRRGFW